MSKYVPIFLSLQGKDCLVVGGGKVAERKVKNIIDAGAIITVISPEITDGLKKLHDSSRLRWEKRNFKKSDLKGFFMVFAATDDERLNMAIAEICNEKNILVNVAKPGKKGNFIVPSSVRKKELIFAFSTSGTAPFFSALIKLDIEKKIATYSKLFRILKPFRGDLLTKKEHKGYNKLIYKTFFNDDCLKFLEQGREDFVERIALDFFRSKVKDG